MQETQEMWVQSLGWEDPLEEGMAIHPVSWRIPQKEEPGKSQFTGSQRVWHDWSELAQTICKRSLIEKEKTGSILLSSSRILPISQRNKPRTTDFYVHAQGHISVPKLEPGLDSDSESHCQARCFLFQQWFCVPYLSLPFISGIIKID